MKMAKGKKKAPMVSKRSAKKASKVWHISRFRQRYELADDVYYDRKSPLLYTKDFIGSGSDDESCAYWRQLMALRSKPNWLVLRGAFAELKNVAGNMSNTFRGYLLNSKYEPASEKEISRWLFVDKEQAKQILIELKDVDLLELVDIPDFDMDNDSQAKSKSKKKKKKHKKSTAKRKKGDSVGCSGISRNRTKPSGINRKRAKPLKKKAKAKVKVKAKANGKGNSKINKKRQKKPPTPTTQPIKPQVSAERAPVIQFPGPSELKNTERIGVITKKILNRYNPESKQFASEIYQALKLPWDPTSEQGKRELGCFASVWQKVAGWQNAGIPPPVLDELRAKAIAEARKIAAHQQNRKKGAVWCTVFKNLEAASKRRAM